MAYAKFEALPTQFVDANGAPLSGGSLTFYLTGTSTEAAVYSDSAGTPLATGAVTLNSRGTFQTAGGTPVEVYGDTDVVYDATLKDSAGATIDTYDELSPAVDSLRFDLAKDDDAAFGSDLIGHYDPVAPTYLKTLSDIINGGPVSAFRFIATSKHAGIRAESNTDDLTTSFDDMATAGARKIWFPNGRYNFSDFEISTNYSEWEAETVYGVKLRGLADAVNMITISAVDVSLKGFQLRADTGVRTGTGAGIKVDAGMGITQNSVNFKKLYITEQPGDGIEAVKQEHAVVDGVWCIGNGGRGFYYHDGGANIGINCYFLNCRAQENSGTYQWQITNQIGYTFINAQSLKGTGTAEMFLQSGTGHEVLNCDIERTTPGGVGILCSTSKAVIRNGTIQKLLTGIQVNSASDVSVIDPRLVGDASTPMTNGVEYISATRGDISLEVAPTNVTTPISLTSSSPSYKQGSVYTNLDTRKKREIIASAASITPDASAGAIKQITLGENITINAPTNPAIGARLRFNLIQDGAGGWTTTWNSIFYFNVAWSDAGNTSGRESTVEFEYTGSKWRDIGRQAVWAA